MMAFGHPVKSMLDYLPLLRIQRLLILLFFSLRVFWTSADAFPIGIANTADKQLSLFLVVHLSLFSASKKGTHPLCRSFVLFLDKGTTKESAT
ncbi:hypothetical protein FB45DRAFT_12442 [Roridomyces roridus]|uniref:Uncharacterized protein n=1 Tax=Roridomyces roridus TaxID=1738132 RepID=A0AAD7CLD2_9AGAR|nr:hypothetical protein FB45DRAFT_12442 [Roridomyces roridus]